MSLANDNIDSRMFQDHDDDEMTSESGVPSAREFLFSHANNPENDDILDEFLDQRVYDNQSYSPEKSDLMGFYSPNNPDAFDLDNNYTANTSMSHNNDSEFLPDLNSLPVSPNMSQYQSMKTMNDSIKHENNHDTYSNELNEYEQLRDEISKLKFGKYDMKVTPDSTSPGKSLLDFSPEAMNKLPYKLSVSELPTYSRVETQIKVKFNMNPSPPQNLVHIPQDLIAKNKFCLSQDFNTLDPIILKNLLYLDCYVLTSDLSKSCNICSKCIKREQKRASRRRNGVEDTSELPQISPNGIVKNNPNSWADEHMIKKAIIFNCKEIVSFPPPNGLNEDKELELCGRIICYCRHHQESNGFRMLFVIRDVDGNVVAKQLSSSIMIMDRKKSTNASTSNATPVPSTTGHTPNMINGSSSRTGSGSFIKREMSPGLDDLHPISPNSIDESSDLTTNESDRNLKRKKLSIDDSNNSNNPMYNGSVNGFSPVSNSDTNTNTSFNNAHSLTKPGFNHRPSSRIPDSLSNASMVSGNNMNLNNLTNNNLSSLPTILRIIPAQGPIRGGIEITLLGFNFNPNLSVKFGSNAALATHCWSETTIVTYLPPAAQPGQVLVTFENHESMLSNQQQQIFTYTDDTDKQLIELALQIVGLKMNGKLEDAKNIAKRIVGNDNSGNNTNANNSNNVSPNSTPNDALEWYNNAQGIVEKLTKMNYSTEEILINFLKLVDLPNCPIMIPNWQLTNGEGQTLLHLSTIKGYKLLIKFLINHGCKIDLQDNQGLTPLFYASINGQRDMMDLFISCKANVNLRLSNDKTLKDYCDLNVIDMLQSSSASTGTSANAAASSTGTEASSEVSTSSSADNEEEVAEDKRPLPKSNSIDSLNSMFGMRGLHISKMVPENIGNDSEFADSEYSEYDGYESSIHEVEQTDTVNDSSTQVSKAIRIDNQSDDVTEDNRTSGTETEVPNETSSGLWQKVKNVFNNSDEDLPNYDELFPFGPSIGFRPKTITERQLNEKVQTQSNTEGSFAVNATGSSSASVTTNSHDKDKEDLSDSSEDMIISYINHPRKTVENDKMLIFFWVPILIMIVSLFISISVIGYKFESVESVKTVVRDSLGNFMLGNERIKRVFRDHVNV